MKIFLSSTFLDLRDVRSEIGHWLQGVFGADLVVMETFGSDADPPDIHSVGRVRECDLFVGIYAHRYGTVDRRTGKSITELELDEAERSHSAGNIRDILLYRIAPGSTWLAEHTGASQSGARRLEALKRRARQHTCDTFRDRDELLFNIVRDVHRRVSDELGTRGRTIRRISLPRRQSLDQPIGMEFLTSAQRDYLVGREAATRDLLGLLASNPIVLLLGESGVGKTSLIHAGLIPAAVRRGMYPVYTRPLGLPSSDILRQVLTAAYTGRATYRGPLVPLLAELAVALGNRRLLLVIDQFEDILTPRDESETDRLVADLCSLQHPSGTKMGTLIVYRADLEGRLGVFWQRVSGSPTGLPRCYLNGISAQDALLSVSRSVSALGVETRCSGPEQQTMADDLLRVSKAAGYDMVYPPFVQMLIDHIWMASAEGSRPYAYEAYRASGGADRILGDYLEGLLRYAGDDTGSTRAVLAALVRSYGVRAQLALDEVCAEASLGRQDAEAALERLIDMRLVRHVSDRYEVSHDFVAKRIAAELLSPEELEAKRYRELLCSKAAAFSETRRTLDQAELLMLYKHKERIAPGEPELRLLLETWIGGKSPGLYWLAAADPALLSRLLNETASRGHSPDEKTSLSLLRRWLDGGPVRSADLSALSRYRLSAERASLIARDPRHTPRSAVLQGLRHKREEVREACLKALLVQVAEGAGWIEELRRRNSDWAREGYESLVLAADLTVPRRQHPSRASSEFTLLRQLATAQTETGAKEVLRLIRHMRLPRSSGTFAEGLCLVRTGRMDTLLRRATRLPESSARRMLGAISPPLDGKTFTELLTTYAGWASEAQGEHHSQRRKALADALARAIRRTLKPGNVHAVRRCLMTVAFGPSTRWLVLAAFEHGGLPELKVVLHRVAADKSGVEFWNHTAIGRALARRLEGTCSRVPPFLHRLARAKEFWEYVQPEDRVALRPDDRLPLKDARNRSLFIRLAAYGMIGSAGQRDESLLLHLSRHP